MTIVPGTKLGHYEILSQLGAGGMGEVYRARDTRLNREVAIKVLPTSFSNDEDRLHSAIEVLNATLKKEPEELTETNSKINPALERIVHRCLEKKPERRFQSTSDLWFAIEALVPSALGASQAAVSNAFDMSPAGERGGLRHRIWMITAGVLG